MFHVLDHADVVYTGELSDSTRYVIEHYDKTLDEAVRSGIRILYTDALHSLMQVRECALKSAVAARLANAHTQGNGATAASSSVDRD